MPTESLSNICNQSLDESKAENVIILDVRTVSSFADEIIPSDTVQCGVGENVEHVIVIFKDPIEKEDK